MEIAPTQQLLYGADSCNYTKWVYLYIYNSKAKEKLNLKFFEDFPELVLYGELVGPDNPYVSKEIYGVRSVAFYIFDIREKNTGKPLQ